jgi:hypothetical protein
MGSALWTAPHSYTVLRASRHIVHRDMRRVRGTAESGGVGALREQADRALIQKLICIETTEQVDQFCDHASPCCLMVGSQTRAVFVVEVFVEQDVILPLYERIFGGYADISK